VLFCGKYGACKYPVASVGESPVVSVIVIELESFGIPVIEILGVNIV